MPTNVQPPPPLHLSTVHGLPSSHTTTAPPLHLLFVHFSPVVQGLLSSQVVCGEWEQPVVKLHLSLVHGLSSAQVGPVPRQARFVHLSLVVHGFSSSHALPSLLATCLQASLGSHVSLVQALPSSQFNFKVELHTPPTHCSVIVHTLPSSQGPVTAAWLHLAVTVLQVSVVHGFLSSQSTELSKLHAPFLHLSLRVHALLSSQMMPSALGLHAPLLDSHTSWAQVWPASQTLGVPALQAPLLHVSPKVHASPSLQETPSIALPNKHLSPVLSQLPTMHGSSE